MDEEKETPGSYDAGAGKSPANATPDAAPAVRENAQGRDWQAAKIAFGHEALREALNFLRMDNEMVAHCNTIMAAVAREIEANPGKFLHSVSAADSGIGKLSSDDIIGGQDKDLLIKIFDFMTGDKDFVIKLITKLFGL
jgi:hypothetical protein